MARTFHHSHKHGPRHRWNQGSGYMGGGMRRGEAPSWHVRLHDTRPQRRADTMTLHRMRLAPSDADSVAWAYTGTKRPHKYYW